MHSICNMLYGESKYNLLNFRLKSFMLLLCWDIYFSLQILSFSVSYIDLCVEMDFEHFLQSFSFSLLQITL